MSSCEQPGIVVLGCPRSGTTLLRRVLGAHPRIASAGETGVLRGGACFLASEKSGVGVEMGVLAGLAHSGLGRDAVIARTRQFVFSFLEDIATAQGKDRWLEKDAFNSFCVDGIDLLCGDEVRYIVVVRHGLDVCASLHDLCSRSGAFLYEIRDYVGNAPSILEAFANVWVDTTRSLMRLVARRPDSCKVVRYEDLVACPEREFLALTDFLGESLPADLIHNAMSDVGALGLGDWKTYERHNIDSSSVNRWGRFHPYTLSNLAELVNPLLASLDYEQVETSWSTNPDDALRRYELGLRIAAMKRSI